MTRAFVAGLGLFVVAALGAVVAIAAGLGLGAVIAGLTPALAAVITAVDPVAGVVTLAADPGPADRLVLLPWGDWLAAALGHIGVVLMAVVMWVLRQLPGQVVAILKTLRVEQLLERAIDYGVNATRGAVAGRTLSLDVGSAVFAEAFRYAADRAPGWLLAFVGDEQRLAEMIWSRLKLDADASLETVRPPA